MDKTVDTKTVVNKQKKEQVKPTPYFVHAGDGT